jgi:hypothetical protein
VWERCKTRTWSLPDRPGAPARVVSFASDPHLCPYRPYLAVSYFSQEVAFCSVITAPWTGMARAGRRLRLDERQCTDRHAAPATISCTTSFTRKNIRTPRSSYPNFLTPQATRADDRLGRTQPFFVESAWGRCSRPICNFAKSCWDRRRLGSASGPALARSRILARLSIRRSYQNPETTDACPRRNRSLPSS